MTDGRPAQRRPLLRRRCPDPLAVDGLHHQAFPLHRAGSTRTGRLLSFYLSDAADGAMGTANRGGRRAWFPYAPLLRPIPCLPAAARARNASRRPLSAASGTHPRPSPRFVVPRPSRRSLRVEPTAADPGRTCGRCPRSGPAWSGRPSPANGSGAAAEEADALEQVAVGDAGRREHEVARPRRAPRCGRRGPRRRGPSAAPRARSSSLR